MTQTNRPDPGNSRSTGSYSVRGDERARRRPAWLIPLLALLGLLLLGLLLWRLLSGGDDDDPTAAAVPTPSAVATSAPASPSGDATATGTPGATGTASGAAGSATGGQLLLGGQSVLPLPAGGDLNRYNGETATARAVQVQSVPADEGFWAGSSTTDRVWVQLTGQAGESGYVVKQGDRISFDNGRTVANEAGFAERAGVSATEGAAQLTSQGQHIEVAKSALTLSP